MKPAFNKGRNGHALRVRQWMKVVMVFATYYMCLGFVTLVLVPWFFFFIAFIVGAFLCMCCVAVPYTGFCGYACDMCPLVFCKNSQAAQRRSLLVGVSCVTMFLYFYLNYNKCLAVAITLEFIVGSRGAPLILVFYIILCIVDSMYGPAITPKQVRESQTFVIDSATSATTATTATTAADAVVVTVTSTVAVAKGEAEHQEQQEQEHEQDMETSDIR